MMKKAVLLLAVISLFVTGAFAKTQALIRKDGRRHVGLITKAQNRDGYNVKMKIGVIFVPSNEVARIEDAATPLEEFRTRLAKVKPDNVRENYRLAQWAFKEGLLSEAGDVLKAVLKIDAKHERAKLLLEEIEAKKRRTDDPTKLRKIFDERLAAIGDKEAKKYLDLGKWAYDNKLLSKAKEVLTKALEIDPKLVEAKGLLARIKTDVSTGDGSTGGVNRHLLSVADIYKVRFEEFDQKNDSVRVRYRKRVLERFVTAMSGRGEFREDKDFGRKFMSYAPLKQLQYILHPEKDIPPEVVDVLKKDILIETDPVFMKTFRVKVWPIVRKSCATAACHGAPEGVGKFKLFNSMARNDRINYTNFIILAGTVNKKGGRMLDSSDDPSGEQNSLLLEYLLPKSVAKPEYLHPKTKKAIQSRVKDRKQPVYRTIRNWISSLSAKDGYPNYRLDYKPPFGMKLMLSGGGGALDRGGKDGDGAAGAKKKH